MLQKRLRAFIFTIACMTLIGLVFEALITLTYPQENIKKSMQEVIGKTRIDKKKPENKTVYNIKRHILDLNYQAKAPHPYLGYIYNRALRNYVNRDGFDDDVDFSKKGNQHFNIGIFGGSLAKDFANHTKQKIIDQKDNFVFTLAKVFPQLFQNKKPRLLSYAVSGYKQPQQLIASLLYSEGLHLIINIDGYNEITGNVSDKYPLNFPNYSNLFYSLDPARNQHWLDIYRLTKQRINITNFLIKFDSSLIRLTWKVYDKYIGRKINYYQRHFSTNLDRNHPFYDSEEFKGIKENEISRLVNNWKKYTLLQHQLMKINNIDYLHFIQPNQHVLNSKALTKEEKENFLVVKKQKKITESYEHLEYMASDLKAKGHEISSLKQVFKSTKETVYRDSCCHINKLGNNILDKAIEGKLIDFYEKKYKPTKL